MVGHEDKSGSTARILGASLAGTAVEFYDFYIYATAAALVFGPLFFPADDPGVQLLLSFASLGVAFVARPLGAIAFGHFGDRIGRKSTLVASLLIMGLSTLAIAFLPTYADIGWLAPVVLCLLRFGQGFGLGGEWSGAALLAVENAPPGWRGRFGCVPQLGAPVGFLAANGLFLLLGLWLSADDFKAWGWRVPFALSVLLIAVGLWVRLRLTETPAFTEALKEAEPPKVPLAEVFRTHGTALLAGTFGVVACFATFYIATAFALGYGTTALGYPRAEFLQIQLGAILFMAGGIILAGWLSDVWNPGRVLMIGCVGVLVAGALMPVMLVANAPAAVFGWLSFALVVMGFVYGPLGAWLPSLFAPRVAYTGTAITFNVGGVIGGGLTPLIAQGLATNGGLGMVGAYLAGAGVLSLIALLALRRSA
ncbi:MAG: MFS transporter [Pseudomonadota bacterium]